MPINRTLNYERITANAKNKKYKMVGYLPQNDNVYLAPPKTRKKRMLEGRDLSLAVGTVFVFQSFHL